MEIRRRGICAALAIVLLPAVSKPSPVQITAYSPLISIAPVNCFFDCPASQIATGSIVNGEFDQQLGSTTAPNPEASLHVTVSADGSAISASGAAISYTGGNNPYSIAATSQLNMNFSLSEAVNYSLLVALPVSNQATATSSISFYYIPQVGSIEAIYSAQNQNSVFNPPFSATGLFQPGDYTIALSAVASGYGLNPAVAQVSSGYSFDLQMTPVPLPGTLGLLFSGVGFLAALLRERKRGRECFATS